MLTRLTAWFVFLPTVLCSVATSEASVSVFVNDQAGFAAATTDYGLVGLEDFEDNTIAGPTSSRPLGTLTPGPSTFFPNGLEVPATFSASSGVRAVKDFGLVAGTVLSNIATFQAFNIGFDAIDAVRAVEFDAVAPVANFASVGNGTARFTLSVRLADNSFFNLGTISPVDPIGSLRIGLATPAGSAPITQVTLNPASLNGSTLRTTIGLDNLAVYITPEPSGLLVSGLLGLLGVAAARRR